MPAYIISDIEIRDAEAFEQYKQLSPPSVAKYGGRFVIRGGAMERIEGEWAPRRIAMLEFPDMETARRWVDSPEYAEARKVRQASATSSLILVDGAAPGAEGGTR